MEHALWTAHSVERALCGEAEAVEHRRLWNIGSCGTAKAVEERKQRNSGSCGTSKAMEHRKLWNSESCGRAEAAEHRKLWNIVFSFFFDGFDLMFFSFCDHFSFFS